MRLGEGIGSNIRCAALAASSGAVRHRVLQLRSSTLRTSVAECCTCEATLPTLPLIIAGVPAGQGRSLGHFLGLMCLFRPPLPNLPFRPPHPPPAWPAPVSACQHGL